MLLTPIFVREFRRALLSSTIYLTTQITGLSPSEATFSKALLLLLFGNTWLHISFLLPEKIQFVLFSVRSPLLRESLLIFFPPPTKMFQFSGFPILSDQCPKTLRSRIG